MKGVTLTYAAMMRSMVCRRGFSLLQCRQSLVMAEPMVYFENPWGLMRSCFSMSSIGEGTRPSRFSSMITILSRNR